MENNEEKRAERKRNTRHKKEMISVSPSSHDNLRVMHCSLKLMLRESDKPRHSVSICEGVLTPVKMCFLNTIWGCNEQLPLYYTITELMATSNSIKPNYSYCPEKQPNSITSTIFKLSSIVFSKNKLLELSKYH